ncbi:hypothetical protein E2562_003179 [Oryza meyeriana var. granulata]|uniref:Galactose oxidase/kelch repeat superfamily protein n=1 Tax=Oryza meyeriana var. granulata TaxID=110450 RepID=A0A6G1EUT2_9ORYZ|nr:hypothetical protein E2562_003179 [Oryza meyeriana var. granulata]
MITGRAFCKASLLNNKLYVVGGVSKGKSGLAPLQSAEVFDPRTGVWAEVPDMPFSKAQALPTAFLAELLKPIATGMTSYGGKLYVPQSLYSWPFFVDVGGEIFDPETNSWAEMPVGMGEGWPARQAGTKLSAVIDGDLYALEPSTSSDRGFLGKLHLIIKDVNSKINIMQTDVLKPVELSDPGTGSTCQNQHLSSEQETNLWKVIASKNLAAAELVSCQVLNI